MTLEEYQYKIEYQRGKLHDNADFMSRIGEEEELENVAQTQSKSTQTEIVAQTQSKSTQTEIVAQTQSKSTQTEIVAQTQSKSTQTEIVAQTQSKSTQTEELEDRGVSNGTLKVSALRVAVNDQEELSLGDKDCSPMLTIPWKHKQREPENTTADNDNDGRQQEAAADAANSDEKGQRTNKIEDVCTAETKEQCSIDINIEALKLDQQQDEIFQLVIGWLKDKPSTKKELRKSLPATRILWRHNDSLMFIEGILFKRLRRNRDLQPTLQIVFPQS